MPTDSKWLYFCHMKCIIFLLKKFHILQLLVGDFVVVDYHYKVECLWFVNDWDGTHFEAIFYDKLILPIQ